MKTKLIFLTLIVFTSIKTVSAYIEVKDSLNPEISLSDSITSVEKQDYSYSTDKEDNDHVTKEQNGDTTFITMGKKKIKIFEENGETSVRIEDQDKCVKQYGGEKLPEEKWKRYKGHWAGFEFGLNNYVNSSFSFDRTEDDKFMDIKPGGSWNFNLNFAQYSLGLGSDKFGITTGAGIEWNNYHFIDSNSIQKQDGMIVGKPIPENAQKNRFQTTYLTIPLLLEYQFPNVIRKNRAYIAAGGIMGIKLFSNTKIKYSEGGSKQKEKYKNDYYLNSLRFGLTARLGYKDCAIYMNYYLTPLFIEDHGPELYPLAAGFVISF
jgi:hypothetical protein